MKRTTFINSFISGALGLGIGGNLVQAILSQNVMYGIFAIISTVALVCHIACIANESDEKKA